MRIPLAFSAVVALLAASGCGGRDEALVRISVIPSGEAALSRPGKPALVPEIAAATGEGLVGFDAQGRVVPALADRWIITDDGLSYIFRLRSGTWGGRRALTAEAVATALRQRLRSLRRTPLGLDLAPVDEVRPMAARVIEIRLTTPLPDLLAILAQPELGLTREGLGSGAMTLQQHGAVVQLEPVPPEQRGQPEQEGWRERVRTLRVRVEPAAAAVARFDQGFADLVIGGRTDTLPLVTTAGLSRGTVRLDPVMGLFGLLVVTPEGFLGTAENREAVAMAIDRDALLGAFNVAGWLPTSRIVAPDLVGDDGSSSERWVAFTGAERRQIAAARVARWQSGARDQARIRIALPQSPGGDLIFARLRDDLSAIGLATVRVGLTDPADLRLIDRVAVYGRPEWFLHQLTCAVKTPVCSDEGDAHLAAAAAAPDPQTRSQLLREAESKITAANGFIPFARPLRWSLVRADVTGFAINPWAVHPLLPLALAPR